jgi:two-component system, NarL family, sensor histidine kinase DesK
MEQKAVTTNEDPFMRDANIASTSLPAKGRTPYLVWLIWVVWLPLSIPTLVQFLQMHPTLPRLIATLTGVVLFFGLYMWAAWRRAQSIVAASSSRHAEVMVWLRIAALLAINLILMLLGGNEWQTLFFYISGYVGGSLSIRRSILATIVLTLISGVLGLLSGLGWFGIVQAVVFIPAIVFITQSVIWSIKTNWELRAAREEIARLAVMTERLRIARDLHDLLGHNLSLIALKSELAGRLVGTSPERATIEIGDVEKVARTTLQEVREAVSNYRRPTLLSELHAAQEILAAAGIAYQHNSDDSIIDTLPTTVESVLAWAVREGVTNVIRHSRAHECMIGVGQNMHDTWVEVTDDGIGTMYTLPSTDNGGNGLRGLSERVEALGGRCETTRPAEGGFRLSVSVPHIQRNLGAKQPNRASHISPLQQPTTLERADSNGQRSTQP